jgi:Leucine-rich repeat (LRR) protein
MIISSQGEACSPNDDINALDMHGTKALRDSLIKIKARTAGGEEALLAGAEIDLEQEKQGEEAKIGQARQALQEFRHYLLQCSGVAADALPSEEELEYSFNYETQECEITRLDGQDIVLDLNSSHLEGELPLPAQLMVTRLYCANNQLTALPELPDSLTLLNCRYNDLTTLPELPASLPELWCDHNQLTTLPELPDSLTLLNCRYNDLTTLPELPASLPELWCDHNQLTTLPELPDSLTKLYCSSNQITTLPELPDSLTEIDFNINQLAALPTLPTSLTTLWCRENPRLASDPATQLAIEAMVNRGGRVYS